MKNRLEILIKKHPLLTFFFLAWTLFFFVLWKNMLVEKSDGLHAGHPYVWADWSMHTGLVSSFAYKPIVYWFSSHPFYAGAPLNYPFATNLISGMFIRMGLSLPLSMGMPSFFFSLFLLVGLFFYYKRFLLTSKMRIVAMSLFLWSGGIGFALAKTVADPTAVLTKIPEKGIEFTNIILGMLVPQRAFLLGLPIGLFLLSSIIAFTQKKKISSIKLIVMGVVAGLLPLIHTHTYITIVLFCAVVVLFQRSHIRKWTLFAGTSALVSFVVYILFLRSSVRVENFFSWQPGWYVRTDLFDWVLFWFRNWGVFFPLALCGTYLIYKQKRSEFVYVVAWWVIFIAANLIQFQPQTWDNSKLLAWAYVGLAVPATMSLHVLWKNKWSVVKSVAPLLFVGAILSGMIDLWHMLDFPHQSFRMLTQEEIILGRWVRMNTSPDSVFITPELVSNPIPMESGRSVIMGYSGWVFSYGFPYTDRQRRLQQFYSGAEKGADAFPEISSSLYVYIPRTETRALELYSTNIVFENPAGRIIQLTK